MFISALIWLLSKLSEKSIDQILNHFNAKKEAQKNVENEFMQIYTSLRHVPFIEAVDSHLYAMREFFIREYELLEKPEIAEFYEKWIKPREIALMVRGDDGFWSDKKYKEQLKELFADLDKIKPIFSN